jgi:diguanylate cyclase (GGDEF)-like protein/PAS domain S-box-containing protein
MRKSPDMIIIYSVLAGVFFVMADSVINAYLHQNGSFPDVLLYNTDELYLRLLVIASFLIFGLIINRLFKQRLRIEAELIKSREQYGSLVNSTNDSIYVVDRDCGYLFMNEIYMARLGISADMCTDRKYNEFHTEQAVKIFSEIVKKVFVSKMSLTNEFYSEKDGNFYLQTFSPVRDQLGEITAVTVISKEINERKQMEERLRTLAITDDLTGLLNRRGFFLIAQKQLKQAKREKRSIFLISADLDNLKVINDRFGHSEGDWVLMETSNILEKCYRESDIIARLGGDEFVILINEYPGTDIETLTERLKEKVDFFNAQSVKPYKLSISTGIVRSDLEKNAHLDDLLSQADRLMYKTKAKNKKLESESARVSH